MFFAFLKIALFGVLATISAKTGIIIFYEIFPLGSVGDSVQAQVQAIKASIIGFIFAFPFLFFMIKSTKSNKKKKKSEVKKIIKVNKENLNEIDPFFDVVKELKRK